jgi:F-type H+-transporting ATPase subunit delta
MAELSTLARPYAEAVFRLAKTSGDRKAWSDRLSKVGQVVGDPQMRTLIADPNVSAAQVADLIVSILGDSLGDNKGVNFIKVLAENNRLTLLPEIEAQFEALKADAEGVVEAKISSAQEMSNAQVNDLVGALKKKYGRDVQVSVSVDATLIGGVVLAIGDRVIDGSVRGRLEKMAFSLKS